MHSLYCENCEQSKKDLNDAKLRLDEFQSIAKKIVQTDLLYSKYSDKEKECTSLELNLKNKQKDYESLNEKYKSTLKENESIKKEWSKEKVEMQNKLKDLKEKLESSEKNEINLNKKILTLNKTIEEHDKTMSSSSAQINSLKNELKQALENYDRVMQDLENLKKIQIKEPDKLMSETLKDNKSSELKFSLSFSLSNSSDENTKDIVQDKETTSNSPAKTPNKKTGFYLESDEETELMYNKVVEVKSEHKKATSNYKPESPAHVHSISDSNFSLFGTTSKLDDDSLSFNKIVNQVLVDSEKNKSIIDRMDEYKQAEDNLSIKTNRSRLSSSSSSTSISSTGSSSTSSDSSSSSSTSSRSVNKNNKNIEDPLNFNVSDEEIEEYNEVKEIVQKNEVQEELVDVNDIQLSQLSQNDNELNFSDEVMSTSSEKEEDNSEREKEKQLEMEKQRKEEEIRLENEKKIDKLVDEFSQRQQENCIDETISQVVVESFMIEFIRDKLINEEINSKESSTSKIIRAICSNVIDEEKAELKRQEKQLKQELKTKLETEFLEHIINYTTDSLMKECCDRVIWEVKNERVTYIYESILDEVVKKLIHKSLMDLVFDEMIIENKPLINKLPPYVPKSPPKEIHAEADKKLPSRQYGKRRLESLETPSTSIQSSVLPKYESPAKKLCTHLETKFKKSTSSSPDRDERHFTSHFEKQTNDSTWASFEHIKHMVKDCLAEYFKKFNIKTGFNYEELDKIIFKLVDTVNNKLENASPAVCSKFLAQIIVLHYINNKFIPLDEIKIKQQDESDGKMYNQFTYLKKSNSANTAYLQSKLEGFLVVRKTKEEEKYEYLIQKLNDYENFKYVSNDFLNCLKTMIFSTDFTEFYNYRLGRMMCFVCKSIKNVNFLRAFIYDLITIKSTVMGDTFYILIVLFARIWPESLNWPFYFDESLEFNFNEDIDVLAKKNPILCVIIYIVRNHMMNQNKICNTHSTNPIHFWLYVLERLCNWTSSFSTVLELWTFFKNNLVEYDLFKEDESLFILNDDEFKLNNITFEYMHAIKLICISEGWQWTLENFLKVFIRQVFDEYSQSIDASVTGIESIARKKHLLAFYILVEANVVSHLCPKKDANIHANNVIKTFGTILKSSLNDKDMFLIECSLIESLLLLSPFNPVECFNHIRIWAASYKKKYENESIIVPKSIQINTKYGYNFYKDLLPNNLTIAF